MIRNFFVDFVIVVAFCAVVWGSVPAWAACLCTENVAGTCPTGYDTTPTGDRVCKNSGAACGTRWFFGTISCACGFKTNQKLACSCVS